MDGDNFPDELLAAATPAAAAGEAERILRFWRDVELLNVSQSPRIEERYGAKTRAYQAGQDLPWMPGHPGFLRPTESKVWFHRVHMGIGDRQLVVRRILDSIGAEVREDDEELTRINGDCWAFGFMVDWRGKVLRESFTPASFAVVSRLLAQGKPVDGAEMTIAAVQRAFLEEHPEGEDTIDPPGESDKRKTNTVTLGAEAIAWEHLQSYLSWTPGLLGSSVTDKPDLVIESIEMNRARPGQKQNLPDGSFMNSFYLQDLRTLIEKSRQGSDLGGPLKRYIGAAPRSRIDIGRDPSALVEAARPARLASGRWPSTPGFGLAVAQQAAVGAALHDDSPLCAVNGPPGTGKTTLLRDIIADVTVQRARAIANLARPEDVFTNDRHYYGDNRVTAWRPEVVDGFGIVVTSSNNAAVENISDELPRLDSIDRETFRGAGFLQQLSTSVMREKDGAAAAPSWGMMSAAMGARSKRWDFFRPAGKFTERNAVSRGEASGLVSLLYERRGEARRIWHHLRDDFLRLDREVKGAVEAMDRVHASGDNRDEMLGRLSRKTGAALPDAEFMNKSREEQQSASLWTFPDLEERRSKLFLAGMRLVEATLAVNVETVKGNFAASRDIMLGLRKDPPSPELRRISWDTIFMTVPVVATTLASFSNLFAGMGRESIGWVLMDEAGQAVPQAVAGALWRAKRSVIIGDPFQVEPVQTVPSVLIEHLRKLEGVAADFCPATESVQTVADRTMELGGEVLTLSGRPVWAGLPLRAHRRCAEPMFSVSNRIAYAEQMVQAAPRRPRLDSPFGASSWIDIQGSSSGGHVVREEMIQLEQMLRDAARSWPATSGRDASIFIITPFKRVQHAIEGVLRKLDLENRIACGTIHSFQGREADIVLIVLGSAPGEAGRPTRDWASSRPNILNVALTRARSRVHILGSVNDWGSQPYFDILARRMDEAGRILTVERDPELEFA